jgi:hypothetical protein
MGKKKKQTPEKNSKKSKRKKKSKLEFSLKRKIKKEDFKPKEIREKKEEKNVEDELENLGFDSRFMDLRQEIQLPELSEPILERVRGFGGEETLEQNIAFTPVPGVKAEKYHDNKYEDKYSENKYEEETPNYTGKGETGKEKEEKKSEW